MEKRLHFSLCRSAQSQLSDKSQLQKVSERKKAKKTELLLSVSSTSRDIVGLPISSTWTSDSFTCLGVRGAPEGCGQPEAGDRDCQKGDC